MAEAHVDYIFLDLCPPTVSQTLKEPFPGALMQGGFFWFKQRIHPHISRPAVCLVSSTGSLALQLRVPYTGLQHPLQGEFKTISVSAIADEFVSYNSDVAVL